MLPNLALLEKIPQKIKTIPNKQGEYKRQIHYGLFLLCQKVGLRISEAINFDLSSQTKKGLYRIEKPKGKKERYVYIPQEVIKELKANNWQPKQTNRFNFYHFLCKIKQELNISQNIELTPHTLRRAFATYHAENCLPLPLLQKLLGHKSVRTTALYWMNIYKGGDDDDDGDVGSILTGKVWLEKPQKTQPEPAAPVNLNLGELPELLIPKSLVSEPLPGHLNKIKQLEERLSQIQSEKDEKIAELTREKETLQNDLTELSEQNTNLQQNLAEKNQVIKELEQKLASDREKRFAAENNLSQEKALFFIQRQINNHLCKRLQTEQENNTNLTQKLHAYEQNHVNLISAYQITLKDKQKAEKQLEQFINEVKNALILLFQWQKLNYYQQLEKQRNETKAQIIQLERPPPWKNK